MVLNGSHGLAAVSLVGSKISPSAVRWPAKPGPYQLASPVNPPRPPPAPGGGGGPLRTVSDDPFEYDVQRRVPNVDKARDVLGYEATTTLDAMLDEVIPWIRAELEAGRL